MALDVVPDLPLRTARLTLRAWDASERRTFVELLDDPAVHRYLYTGTLDDEQAREQFERRLRPPVARHDGDALRLAVDLTATGEFLGEVMFMLTSSAHAQGEVGYVFRPAVAGHGYATEATAALVDLAFAAGFHRVAARADGRNTASTGVMERLGMRREALLRENEFVKGEWTDEIVYAVLAGEHSAGRRG